MSSRRMQTAGSIVLALVVSAAARADEIVLIPGSTVKAPSGRVRGQIQSESPSEVVIQLGGKDQTVPTDQIGSVRYDGQPPSMILAESRESGGSLAEAAELYKKAAAEAQDKPFVLQAAQYHQAGALADLALADPERVAEAIGLLEAFLKAHPRSRHIAPALESLARLQLQKGDYPAAERATAQMTGLPRGADRAAVLRARIFARRGEHAKAIAELDRILSASAGDAVKAREARLAKAESLAGLKKFSEAEADVRAVIQASPPEDFAAQSAAYNTLGDCLRAAGKPKDALLAYLHTDVLYAKDKEQHPRALAQIAQLWRELKREDRANEIVERLKQEYPRSPWLASLTSP
jgi:tetratricopeptide (TPR) repeat protein